jgi:3-dehydroquinate synthetase
MERAAWTDERLDDLLEAVRTGFARSDQDIRDLRIEMHQEFASLRTVLFTFGGGIIVALIGVIAAILARGA